MVLTRRCKANKHSHTYLYFMNGCIILLVGLLLPQATLAFQETSASVYECTQVSLEDIDPALLTKEERIALLDKSLNESINTFSSCVASAQQSMTDGGYGQGDGSGISNESGSAGAGQASAEQLGTNDAGTTEQGATNTEQTVNVVNNPPVTSTTPVDRGIIPPKDNDKIICKLLFQEIQNLKDPAMLKGLKEQYTNYKCG